MDVVTIVITNVLSVVGAAVLIQHFLKKAIDHKFDKAHRGLRATRSTRNRLTSLTTPTSTYTA